MKNHIAVAAALLLALACSNPAENEQGLICTTEARPGLVVEIRDAETGAPLAQTATAIARDGAFADSLRAGGSVSGDPASMIWRAGAHERPGTYSVEIQRAGYRTWTMSNVVVVDGVCHVETRRLTANLVAATP